MDSMTENVIEFLRDQKRATVTFSQGRFISRVKRLAEERPEDCQITAVNADGSIVAHVPVSWVRIQPPREYELTEEQRNELKERAEHMRNVRDTKRETLKFARNGGRR